MAKDVPPWYHGNLTADEATRILTRYREPGAYLLRDSQNAEGAYTLSCTVQESGNFVDVKHYRIVKTKIKKTSKKKFPTFKDIQKCIQKQASERREVPPYLKIAVEKSTIDQWDQTDANWREKFRVHDSKDVPVNTKDPKEHPKFRRFPFSEKEKQTKRVTEDASPPLQVRLLQHNDSSENGVVNKSKTESFSSVENPSSESGMNDYIDIGTEETDPNCTANMKGKETLNQNIGIDKDVEDNGNSSILTQPIATNVHDVKPDDKEKSGGNDNQVKGGIYMSPEGMISRNNNGIENQAEGVGSGKDRDNSIAETTPGTTVDTNAESIGNANQQKNAGIYMSTQGMISPKNIGLENKAEGDGSSYEDHTNSTNPPTPGTTNDTGAENIRNDNQQENKGIYMSREGVAITNNVVPSSDLVTDFTNITFKPTSGRPFGDNGSTNQPQEGNKGIYMTPPPRNTSKDN